MMTTAAILITQRWDGHAVQYGTAGAPSPLAGPAYGCAVDGGQINERGDYSC